ncbi:hypothetical protein B7494_g4957 [Chlorociboria aeruginascens]|nr:hypothetical protein B7494_g4957 [Chlorociboria aeruginascens]
MEGPQRRPERDINDLLLNGYWKTSRGRSTSNLSPRPSVLDTPSFLKAYEQSATHPRSRSQEPPRRRPPRATVEDEVVSLARESSTTSITCYDPPMRGIIDQHPIILEADVSHAERTRLQTEPCPKKEEENPERRFVLVSPLEPESKDKVEAKRTDSRDIKKEPVKTRENSHRAEYNDTDTRPPISRRRSRQDLPSLQTKVPRDLPPQYRRTVSATTSSAYLPSPSADTPKSHAQTPSGEYFLSPEIGHSNRAHGKEYFSFSSQSIPRHVQESFGGRNPISTTENRSSNASISGLSRPTTPEHRKGDSLDASSRNPSEKSGRSKQISEEYDSRRPDRIPSPHSARSSRSSAPSNRNHYSSTDEDLVDSDSDADKHRRRHGHRRHRRRHAEDDPDRHFSQSTGESDRKPRSRYSSPLPSPKESPIQGSKMDQFSDSLPPSTDTRRLSSRPVSPFTAARDTPRASERLNPLDIGAIPRPKSRQAAPGPTSAKIPQSSSATLPIPIPSRIDLHSPGENRPSPTIPQFDEDRSSGSRIPVSPKPKWQPGPFQPPNDNLAKPAGAFRRYSEDIERGTISPLPACPRTTFTRGFNDWLTLPQCPSFDICPSCYKSTMSPTEFRDHFILAPRRPPDTEVLCDFGSSPWYRIAWLLTLKERRKDLGLFYGLAKVSASAQPCLGKHEAIRQWHSIIDPKTRSHIRDFDVCYSCVKSVETLLPSLRGIFVRTEPGGSSGMPKICDLRFDSKRFVQYFDALETTAAMAEDMNGPPDTRDLAGLARRLTSVAECQRDDELIDHRWYSITQLPEFTVCEECYDEVVWPALEDRRAIATMFSKSPHRMSTGSCQLYSPRMRAIFQKAIENDDYKMLASKARERKTIEVAYKANLASLRRQSKVIPQVGKEMARITDEWRKWE